MSNVDLQLNARPDGYGFLYGMARLTDGTRYRVNVLPPLGQWRGDVKLEGYGARSYAVGVFH